MDSVWGQCGSRMGGECVGAWAVPMDDAERVEVVEALAHVRRRTHHLSSKGKSLGSSVYRGT